MNINQTQVQFLKSLCYEAGEVIMKIYNDPSFENQFETKEDNSPLTLADKNSNNVIIKGLKLMFPEIPIISEEGIDIPYEKRKSWATFWLVDPLDGTKEFIKRNGEFTVNIALINNGIPVLGFIYVPVFDELYYSFSGKSFKISSDKIETEINSSKKMNDLVAIGSRTHSSKEDELFLSNYSIKEFISAGSSLKFCRISEGTADIYYRSGPTMEWDTAAGHAIVLGAGGTVENLTYNKPDLKNGYFVCKG